MTIALLNKAIQDGIRTARELDQWLKINYL